MKESLYFSSCDAASNLGCYWYISELKKMCPTETGNEHYWGSKFAWSKCNYIKKNKQNKITKQIKKKDLILFSQFTNIGPKTDQVNQISETILSA